MACGCGPICCVDEDEQLKLPEGFIEKKRYPRDLHICILFIAFWIGMIVIAIFGFIYGNPWKLIKPTDYDQNMCGYPKGSGNKNKVDLTNKKYLWYPFKLTSLDFSENQIIDAISLGICVEKCPKAFEIVCDYDKDHLNSTQRLLCATQVLDECKTGGCYYNFFPTSPITMRCFPTAFNLTAAEAAAFEKLVVVTEAASAIIGALAGGWAPMLITLGIAVILCFIYALCCVRWCLRPITYFVIGTVLVVLVCVCGYFTWIAIKRSGEDNSTKKFSMGYAIGFAALFGVLSAIYLFLLMWLCDRVRLAITLIQHASKAIQSMPWMIILPPITFALVVALTAWWAVVALFLQSSASTEVTLDPWDPVNINPKTGESYFNGSIDFSKNYTIVMSDTTLQYMQIYNIFGYFWGSAFLVAFGYTVIAGVVAQWYFSATDGKKTSESFALWHSFKRTLLYHAGSIALGSLIVAIVQTVRVIFNKLKERLQKTDPSQTSKWIMRMINCCLWILEKIIKFINKNAYIMIAITGHNFCISAQKAFKLIINNVLRVGAVNFISTFVLLLGKILVTVLSAVICYVIIDVYNDYMPEDKVTDAWPKIDYPIVPSLVVGVLSFLIATIFMDVYETTIDTILLCYCYDCEVNAGRPMYAPGGYGKGKSLHEYINENQIKPAAGYTTQVHHMREKEMAQMDV